MPKNAPTALSKTAPSKTAPTTAAPASTVAADTASERKVPTRRLPAFTLPRRKTAAAPTSAPESPLEPGKGRPTPSRREQELARRKPLVATDRKGASKTARADAAIERNRARIGMAAGEERYLLRKDRGPQRRFMRDSVDARYMVGELLYPVFGILLIASFVTSAAVSKYLLGAVWVFAVIVIIDGYIAARTFRKRLAEKVGGVDRLERGLTFYVITRCIQFRTLRTPKPQVKRGAYPR